MTKKLRVLSVLLIVGVLGIGVLIFFPSLFSSLADPACTALLLQSESVPIPLPVNCARTRDVAEDDMTRYLEKERKSRGLTFKEWITCREVPTTSFAIVDDPHWLPSYVPETYQFRRAVVIFPYAHPILRGSHVVAEICSMPWRKYVSEIVGQCTGKFAVWR